MLNTQDSVQPHSFAVVLNSFDVSLKNMHCNFMSIWDHIYKHLSSRCLEMKWKTVFRVLFVNWNSYLILDHSILFLVSDFIPWLYLLFSSVRFFRTFDDELHIKIGLLVPFPIYASICKTLHRYFRLQHFIFFLHPLLPLRSASLHWLSGSRGRLA